MKHRHLAERPRAQEQQNIWKNGLVVLLTLAILLGGWFGLDLLRNDMGASIGTVHTYEKTAAAGDIIENEGNQLNLFPFNQFREEDCILYREYEQQNDDAILSSKNVYFFLENLFMKMEEGSCYLVEADWGQYLFYDKASSVIYAQDMPVKVYDYGANEEVEGKLSIAFGSSLDYVHFYHFCRDTDQVLSAQSVVEGTEKLQEICEKSRDVIIACGEALSSSEFYVKQEDLIIQNENDGGDSQEAEAENPDYAAIRAFMFYRGISSEVPFQRFLYALGTAEIDEEGQNILGQRFPVAYDQLCSMCYWYVNDYTTLTAGNEILMVYADGSFLLFYDPVQERFTGFGAQ